ncbi:MAG: anaerobic magnesium-protoporphyrin IX monomethyl ester [Geobacteraceae bacterium]|nr:MAG: anaerobic magnesium-protoporphyrin IX monomethyl ester [Geobacteraceae bacterium]
MKLAAGRRNRSEKTHLLCKFLWPNSLRLATIFSMKILLATLHAKYVHASLALPYLSAACKDLDGIGTVIREFTINEPADRVLRSIVAEEADMVAFSCYIWNIEQTLRLASDLKKVRPQTFIVLGGPEAGFGVFELMERHPAIDCVVRGEGEEAFKELVAALAQAEGRLDGLQGITYRDNDEIIALPPQALISDLDTTSSPFSAGMADLTKPLVYYETSRGCPFSCAFCMSSLEQGVRSFSMARIEDDLKILMSQKVQTVKLVDRTFNYDAPRANRIWEFILRQNGESRFHFEIAADLLTEENIRLLREVPAGMFRFEIGVQSEGEATLAKVGRKSDLARLFANVARLKEETGVTLHLDLVAGLPHEDFDGFLGSLQRVLEVNPHHIQVEPLKVLKGSPMRRIAADEGYAFSDAPPYKILQTPWLSFMEIGKIDTIARLLDLYYNSGRFAATLTTLAEAIPLSRFFAMLGRYWEEEEITSHLSQTRLFEVLWTFVECSVHENEAEKVRDALRYDYCRAEYPAGGRFPGFFEGYRGTGRHEKMDVSAVVQQLGIEVGSRVRTFAGRFSRDYNRTPWGKGDVELLFVYISHPGRGLQVQVITITGGN